MTWRNQGLILSQSFLFQPPGSVPIIFGEFICTCFPQELLFLVFFSCFTVLPIIFLFSSCYLYQNYIFTWCFEIRVQSSCQCSVAGVSVLSFLIRNPDMCELLSIHIWIMHASCSTLTVIISGKFCWFYKQEYLSEEDIQLFVLVQNGNFFIFSARKEKQLPSS